MARDWEAAVGSILEPVITLWPLVTAGPGTPKTDLGISCEGTEDAGVA